MVMAFFFSALQLRKIQERVMEWANEKGNHITNIIIFSVVMNFVVLECSRLVINISQL